MTVLPIVILLFSRWWAISNPFVIFDLMHRRELFNLVIRLFIIISRAAYFCFDFFFFFFQLVPNPVWHPDLLALFRPGTTFDPVFATGHNKNNYEITYNKWRGMKGKGLCSGGLGWNRARRFLYLLLASSNDAGGMVSFYFIMMDGLVYGHSFRLFYLRCCKYGICCLTRVFAFLICDYLLVILPYPHLHASMRIILWLAFSYRSLIWSLHFQLAYQ